MTKNIFFYFFIFFVGQFHVKAQRFASTHPYKFAFVSHSSQDSLSAFWLKQNEWDENLAYVKIETFNQSWNSNAIESMMAEIPVYVKYNEQKTASSKSLELFVLADDNIVFEKSLSSILSSLINHSVKPTIITSYKLDKLSYNANAESILTLVNAIDTFEQVAYSQSKVLLDEQAKLPYLLLDYGTVQADELPELWLLSYMLQMSSASFQKNMVSSGLNFKGGLLNYQNQDNRLCFYIQPNPFGLKAAIEALFAEMYIIHKFNYATVEEVNIAKRQIEVDLKQKTDTWQESVSYIANMTAVDWQYEYPYLSDSIELLTKRNLMDFVKKYIHNQSFNITLFKTNQFNEDVSSYLHNSVSIDSAYCNYDKKQFKIDAECNSKLKELIYTMNLTPAGEWIFYFHKDKKRVLKKRIKELENYLSVFVLEERKYSIKIDKGQKVGLKVVYEGI